MRSATRTLLTTGATLLALGAVAAQAPSPRPAALITGSPGVSFAGRSGSPAAVIERLVTFDVNADGRISCDELPERMHGLVARGDRNANAALDPDEIRALVTAAASEPVRVSFRRQPSEGLPGVIRDLKLAPAKHLRAIVIVGTHKPPRSVNDPASTAVFGQMKALLDDDEYENFVAAATRLSRGADVTFPTVGGVVGGIHQTSARR